ncbi:unnamed protein product [Trichobilharzia szidati]|nr:unnamed protein product [Trichobilharzia szidati]
MVDRSGCRICVNCKESVLESNFILHEAFCSRNLTTCPDCGENVLRTLLSKHHCEKHEQNQCSKCGSLLRKCDVAEHEVVCPRRLVGCIYCNLEVSMDELDEHESRCGSRTEFCSGCGSFVMIKSLKTHHCRNYADRQNFPQTDYKSDFLMAFDLQCEDYMRNLSLIDSTFCRSIVSSQFKDRSVTLMNSIKNDQESNSLIPCEFCQSAYPMNLISEHQVLCMVGDNSSTELNQISNDTSGELTKSNNDSTSAKSSPKRSLIKSVVKRLPIPQSSSSSSLLSTTSSKRSASVKPTENIPNPDQPSYELPPIKNAPLYKKRYQSRNQMKQTTSHSITAQGESINRPALTNSTLDSWKKKKNGVSSLSNKRNPLKKATPINLVCHSNYAGNGDGFQRGDDDDDNGDNDGVHLRLNTSHTLKKLSK